MANSVDHDELAHQGLRTVPIQLFSSLVVKELKQHHYFNHFARFRKLTSSWRIFLFLFSHSERSLCQYTPCCDFIGFVELRNAFDSIIHPALFIIHVCIKLILVATS